MARSRVKPSTQKSQRQAQVPRPRGIEKPLRRNSAVTHLLLSPPITNLPGPKTPRRSLLDSRPSTPSYPPPEPEVNRETKRKRKRSQEEEASQDILEKRPRADVIGNQSGHRVETWVQEGSYPKDYFELNNQTWEAIEADISKKLEMAHPPFARAKSRQDKSAVYKDASYEQFLKEQGSYLREFHQGIEEDSKTECQTLLNTEHAVPKDSDTLFRDDLFQAVCEKLRGRNEARVVSDIARLIVPSAETLVTYGATHLENLIVGMNERWNESIPLIYTAARPQPDFSVGFQRSAFTREQLKKLEPFTGNIFAQNKLSSFLLATWRIYFPFFTCEVKCGLGGLDIADRQNANSMTLSVRGLVELFRFLKREKELHRRILAFSISHNNMNVRIYGHYPVIDGDKTVFYRHPIKNFDFTSEEGKEKWTAYKFTKNVYNVWMPDHLKLICSAIDDIPPDLDFGVALGGSLTSVASADDSELPGSQNMATSAPVSQDGGFVVPPLPSAKRTKLTPKAMLEQEVERLKEQNKQEREQSNQRHMELMSMLKQKEQEMKELMSMLKQKIT